MRRLLAPYGAQKSHTLPRVGTHKLSERNSAKEGVGKEYATIIGPIVTDMSLRWAYMSKPLPVISFFAHFVLRHFSPKAPTYRLHARLLARGHRGRFVFSSIRQSVGVMTRLTHAEGSPRLSCLSYANLGSDLFCMATERLACKIQR